MALKRILPIVDALGCGFDGNVVELRGWVRSIRRQKRVSFLELNDGSTSSNVQVVTPSDLLPRDVSAGSSVCVSGLMRASEGKGQSKELQCDSVTLVGRCGSDYPLQKKEHSEEFMREWVHLRPRTTTFGATMRIRNTASRALHDHLQGQGFIEVHAPIIVSSDCEGAGEMFRVKGSSDAPLAPPFFGTDAYLTVSAQLHGEAFCCALSKVYVFGPTFRAEKHSKTAQHLAEFWMLEPEVAHHDLGMLMDLAESTVRAGVTKVNGNCGGDLAVVSASQLVLPSSFARMTYTEAITALQERGSNFQIPVTWGMDLQREHERWLCEVYTGGVPVFVTDYPSAFKPFYAKRSLSRPDDCVQAVDLLVPGIGELIGGSVREDDLDSLHSSMEAKNMDVAAYSWYTDLRRFGSVPHAGFGMGFERFLMYVTGIPNIRDVTPVPRWSGHIKL